MLEMFDPNIFKESEGLIFAYSIFHRSTFDELKLYYNAVINFMNKPVPIILVGTMSDMKNPREVIIEEGKKLAKEFGAKFY